MREIKFRAWDKEKKRMLFYSHWFTLHQQTVLCFEERKYHSYIDESDIDYPVRVVLMQFTGLKDSKGVEIYEGDLVKWTKKVYGKEIIKQVQWDDNFAGFFTHKDIMGMPMIVSGESCEVVGNIYENPELLK